VKAYDPIAMKEAQHIYVGDKITYAKDAYDACVDADALLLITEWSEFRIPSWSALGKLLKNKVVFDGRNIYDKSYLAENGFEHYGIGSK
jgi:UDPglucose 6-dehydrogenase